jgi:hypothetical protein
MARTRIAAILLAFLPLSGLLVACGSDDDQRAALQEDELSRDLDLALRGDTLPPTFQDTAVGVLPEPDPQAPPRTAPRPQPRTQQPVQQPVATPRQPTPSAPRTVSMPVPAGTSMALTLNQELSTETNRVGDGFTATLSDPIVSADGTVLVPAGATVRGRVTHVAKSDRVGETAVLKLAFEAISFGGRSYPLQATVVEANPQRRTRTTRTEQAAKIAAGAAAGAVLGQVLGRDRESTLKGAAVGAAAGTAIAMGTADVDAVLPAGSRLVIRLDAPIPIERTIS